MRRRALLAIGVLLAGLVTGPAVARADGPLEYVALGDSSAAGPLILPQIDLAGPRSSLNYPHIAAQQLGAGLTDVTCSGAVIPDFSGKQFGFVPPQYDALSSTTDLVTVAIGGNDTGLVSAALSCINALPPPARPSARGMAAFGGIVAAAAS